MECPICYQKMNLMSQDISEQNGKSYDRKVYFCLKDDVWVTVESPRKLIA
jgi:hypothetical protein